MITGIKLTGKKKPKNNPIYNKRPPALARGRFLFTLQRRGLFAQSGCTEHNFAAGLGKTGGNGVYWITRFAPRYIRT